jgi:putative aminopeptidase FrvX
MESTEPNESLALRAPNTRPSLLLTATAIGTTGPRMSASQNGVPITCLSCPTSATHVSGSRKSVASRALEAMTRPCSVATCSSTKSSDRVRTERR